MLGFVDKESRIPRENHVAAQDVRRAHKISKFQRAFDLRQVQGNEIVVVGIGSLVTQNSGKYTVDSTEALEVKNIALFKWINNERRIDKG